MNAAFIAWMNRTYGRARLHSAFLAYSWTVRGTLVTLWASVGRVKVYHDGGRAAVCFECGGELARKQNDPAMPTASEERRKQ